ncbi:unnamed protein product [[Candida] boidinii]|uniref:Unnamed protein product n=1 Tax=Candida boidinii TaxID=5477 RepID=A0A9W6WED1_CANBO|nr:hypothetical protein B5S30_g251 [[Candida] boidinii]GME66888.1 unnamed protein product [[Candida] boidinii]
MSAGKPNKQHEDMLKEVLKNGERSFQERPLKKRKRREIGSKVATQVEGSSTFNEKTISENSSIGDKLKTIDSSSESDRTQGGKSEKRVSNEEQISKESTPIVKQTHGSISKNDFNKKKRSNIKENKLSLSNDSNLGYGRSRNTTPDYNIEIIDEVDNDEDYQSEEMSFDSDEFEDVEIDIPSNPQHMLNASGAMKNKDDSITVTIKNSDPNDKKKGKKSRSTQVSRDERKFRYSFHKAYLFAMLYHGAVRNMWCNHPKLFRLLKADVPPNLKKEIREYRNMNYEDPQKKLLNQTKTRKLLDVLRHLMEYWYKSFTVTSYVTIFKKKWNELEIARKLKTSKVSLRKFIKLVYQGKGSRDIGAQGFVSLLRSLGFQARLIFSLQPPDFTNLSIVKPLEDEMIEEKEIESQNRAQANRSRSVLEKKPMTEMDKLLASLKVNRSATTNLRNYRLGKENQASEYYSNYPIFWCEVWNPHNKKWITIDPIVKKYIESVNTKSVLEPPLNDERNNAFYVVGFDTKGGARDVTRRYAESYNAKIRKKRITRVQKDEELWNSLLFQASSDVRKQRNRMDMYERLDFEEKNLKEGMPNSIQDFRNHPVYALEEQLKFNEVLYPKISCGTIRRKISKGSGKGETIPVYKRSYVQPVKSAKAWFMNGRVLKVGERPLKVKDISGLKKRKLRSEDNFRLTDDEDDDKETEVNLYAEYQTELYVPPPIVDGKIPENAFGNIDIYTESMLPEGAVHIPGKFAMKAGKIVGVDVVPAVVGFEFSSNNSATAKVDGAVVEKCYKEAVEVVSEFLKEEEAEEKRRMEILIALHGWKVLLKRLEIKKRLNIEHGTVNEQEEDNEKSTIWNTTGDAGNKTVNTESESDGDVSNHSADDDIAPGGFLLGDVASVDADGLEDPSMPMDDDIFDDPENYIDDSEFPLLHKDDEDLVYDPYKNKPSEIIIEDPSMYGNMQTKTRSGSFRFPTSLSSKLHITENDHRNAGECYIESVGNSTGDDGYDEKGYSETEHQRAENNDHQDEGGELGGGFVLEHPLTSATRDPGNVVSDDESTGGGFIVDGDSDSTSGNFQAGNSVYPVDNNENVREESYDDFIKDFAFDEGDYEEEEDKEVVDNYDDFITDIDSKYNDDNRKEKEVVGHSPGVSGAESDSEPVFQSESQVIANIREEREKGIILNSEKKVSSGAKNISLLGIDNNDSDTSDSDFEIKEVKTIKNGSPVFDVIVTDEIDEKKTGNQNEVLDLTGDDNYAPTKEEKVNVGGEDSNTDSSSKEGSPQVVHIDDEDDEGYDFEYSDSE